VDGTAWSLSVRRSEAVDGSIGRSLLARQMNDPSTQSDCNGFSSVARAQLFEDVEEVSFHRRLSPTDSAGDFLVAQTIHHVREHLDLPFSQVDARRVFREALGDDSRHDLFTPVDGTNRLRHVMPERAGI